MFVVIRRYAAGARTGEVARRVGEGLVPVLTKLPGFRAYYCFVGEDGRPVSVSIVESRAAAVVATIMFKSHQQRQLRLLQVVCAS